MLAIGSKPVFALTPTGDVTYPLPGQTYPCALDGYFGCGAYAGPLPGYFTWHIGGSDYGPAGDSYSFHVTEDTLYSVSTTYTYTGQYGEGEATFEGGSIQAVESVARIEGGTTAYLAVNGARKEIQLGIYPSEGGDRNWFHLSVPAGVVVYASETAETPLTGRTWDDYDLDNWGTRPTSIWVEATTSGQKTLNVQYGMALWITPEGEYSSATHTASIVLNCVEANLYVPDVVPTEEEVPGPYLGKTQTRSLYLALNGTALNNEGSVKLTWTNPNKVTVKQGTTVIDSGQTWNLASFPNSVTVIGKAASGDFHDVHFEMEYSGHNISATDRVWMTVVEIVWMPLGQATPLTRFVVGRVYVPTKYGGTLELTGSGSKLYYEGALTPVNDYSEAIDIVKRVATPTDTGNPCSYTVPANDFRWFYVAVDGQASITATFGQQGAVDQPWSCWWYPYTEMVQGDHLYDDNGPLAKYDEAFTSNSLGIEKRNWRFRNGHYFKGKVDNDDIVKAFEDNAENSLGFDIDNADQDDDDWSGWDDNYEYDFWDKDNDTWGQDTKTDGKANISWYGHCTEAAAVSLCETQPVGNYVTTVPPADKPIKFSASDRIALLVALYHGCLMTANTGPDPLPYAWHSLLEGSILSPISAHAFVCDTTNTGVGDDMIWNHPVYGIQEAHYTQKPGVDEEGDENGPGYRYVQVDCTVLVAGANSQHYRYNVRYNSGGVAASDAGSDDWVWDRPYRPDRCWRPVEKTSVSGYWSGQLDYDMLRLIDPD